MRHMSSHVGRRQPSRQQPGNFPNSNTRREQSTRAILLRRVPRPPQTAAESPQELKTTGIGKLLDHEAISGDLLRVLSTKRSCPLHCTPIPGGMQTSPRWWSHRVHFEGLRLRTRVQLLKWSEIILVRASHLQIGTKISQFEPMLHFVKLERTLGISFGINILPASGGNWLVLVRVHDGCGGLRHFGHRRLRWRLWPGGWRGRGCQLPLATFPRCEIRASDLSHARFQVIQHIGQGHGNQFVTARPTILCRRF
mmetsp:Transcript_16392/g.36205  ORF Transcript_16392/g.36205 Transcript_16392/m.36205 type:complete len:253 (-) Transcript_16392:2004-2762(-)